MNRLDFLLVIVSILIIIPHRVNSFFLVSPASINATRNINCQVNGNQTSASNFQLCAIRTYQGMINSTAQIFNLYDGFYFVNALRRYIQTACSTEGSSVLPSDTGFWGCTALLPFETSVSTLTICVCADDNCNKDMDTCQQWVRANTNIPQLVNVMPDLNTILQCSDSLNENSTCEEDPFINVTACQVYVKNNSVLCAITVSGTIITQTSLIYQNYEAYLDEKIYEVKTALSMTSNSFTIESSSNVFYNYSTVTTGTVDECACTSSSFCNEKITTCALVTSATSSQTETTTMSLSSSATVYSSTLIDTTEAPTTMIAISTGSISTATSSESIMTTMSPESTETVMSTESTITSTSPESIMTTMSPESTVTVMSTEPIITTMSPESTITTMSTESTITTMSTEATVAVISTQSIMTTISSGSTTTLATMVSSTTIQSTSSSVVSTDSTATTSTTTQTLAVGEQGLGSAATAGIACGIIFSAVIFTAEIVYFKFFHRASSFSGIDRSVRYIA